MEPDVRTYYLSRILLSPIYSLWEDVVPPQDQEAYLVWNELSPDNQKAYRIDNPSSAQRFRVYDRKVEREKKLLLRHDPLLDVLHHMVYGNTPYSMAGRRMEVERRRSIWQADVPEELTGP